MWMNQDIKYFSTIRRHRSKDRQCYILSELAHFSEEYFLNPLPNKCQTVIHTTQSMLQNQNSHKTSCQGLHSSNCSLCECIPTLQRYMLPSSLQGWSHSWNIHTIIPTLQLNKNNKVCSQSFLLNLPHHLYLHLAHPHSACLLFHLLRQQILLLIPENK